MDRHDRIPASAEPYTALAPLYDRIMAHVDYAHWAEYLLTLCSRFAPPPEQSSNSDVLLRGLSLRQDQPHGIPRVSSPKSLGVGHADHVVGWGEQVR